jgi:uncharacterized membrane protein
MNPILRYIRPTPIRASRDDKGVAVICIVAILALLAASYGVI